MPLTRVIWSPERPCSTPAMTGTPPATAAPCTSCTLCFAASRSSAAPRYAINCLLAVTTDLSAAKDFRSQRSAGSSPPTSSTTMSARELRTSSKFSVHTTEPGTCFAASELRLRAMLRLKMWLSSTPGSFAAASTRVTALPTVPRSSSAILTGAAAVAEFLPGSEVAVFGREVLRWFAILVFDLIHTRAPCVETLHRLVGQQALHGNSALVDGTAYLGIEQRVVKAGGGGIGGGVSVKDGVAARPIEGSQAHRAGLATGVDDASGEAKIPKRLASRANRHHFGMGRGIVGRRNQVHAGRDDLTVAHDHRAKRASGAREHILRGQCDGPLHEDGIAFDGWPPESAERTTRTDLTLIPVYLMADNSDYGTRVHRRPGGHPAGDAARGGAAGGWAGGRCRRHSRSVRSERTTRRRPRSRLWQQRAAARPGGQPYAHQRARPHRVGGLCHGHPRGSRGRIHHAGRHAAELPACDHNGCRAGG